MSDESTVPDQVELTRRSFEAASRHDLDTALTRYAPDAVLDLSDLGIGTFEGTAAIRRFVEDWWGTWSEHLLEVQEIADVGHGVVSLSVREDGRLRGSDGHVEHVRGWVLLWSGGAVQRAMVYLDADHARSAAERLAESRTLAMAPENIEELIRWGYDWFNREREPPPTWLSDGEFVNSREDPDHATYRGIEAIRAQNQGWFDSYPDLHVEPVEILANGNRVFVWTRFTGHGADSGAPMEMELAHVFTMENRRTRRLEEYFDRAEALAAVGLAG
jgi:ketosteroid isomerase-like protein